ncbi:BRCT domain protein [Aspergillus steynii IBT 23096]|uniref:BRCT domain protein n=1 Tax=Aspergillus steynii IBT 23096 TaxID=1392250 RepID=A0A2I2FR77_9EURO|nr:BRCT domain protein [Aspergillus steynii IBT 23096]PLB43135.1 BRCT domain protein [Aspergillus steynii IBT 23096]
METQQDSLDIGYLQRVALGQQLEPIEVSLSDTCDRQSPRNPADSVSLTAPENPRKSPSPHRSPSSLHSPTGKRQHDTEALKSDNRQPSVTGNRNRVPLQRSVKMGSAETVPSDTQVISQSVYDDLIRQNQEAAANNETDNSLADRATLATMYEGDSGHIDLLAGFDHIHTDAANADDNEDQSSFKLGESSPMHYQPSFFPESQRFVVKTPATVVKHSQTEGLNTGSPTVSRNPLASDVGSSGGIMALSQVFRATQAPSSPLIRGQHSDPMSDRPSPNLPIQGHPLATTLSSPLNHIAATFPRDSSEPNLNYVTMKESQAERDRILQERLTRSAEHVYSEDHSDVEFDKEPSFVERMARKRTIDQEAAAQFAGLTTPAKPPSHRSRTSDKASEDPEPHTQEGGQQTHISALPTDEASEEETEHEQESHQPVPKSQELNPSTEEDKENYDDPVTTPRGAATNAHDRLSQVLSLDGSTSPSPKKPTGAPADSQRLSQIEVQGEALEGISRSSQIIVVADSQQSPKYDQDENAGNTNLEPWDQYAAQHPGPHVQSSYDLEKTTSSPQKPIRIQSSPPSASQRSRVSFQLDNRVQPRGRSDSVSSRESSGHPARHQSVPDDIAMQAGHPMEPNLPHGVENTSRPDRLEKSSSMPSRVAETPLHRSRSFGDEIPATDAPETSPNRFQNDLMDQEDDDLPPIHSTVHERISHSQPLNQDSSSPVKNLLNSKILSSPSGRQRRALTEIAADVSPRIGPGAFDIDINLLSAEDQEFRSAVEMSPVLPRKKRRGNVGRNIYASDSLVPVTPGPTSYFMHTKGHERTETEDHPQPKEPQVAPETVFVKRSRPSRRMDTVWDIDDTPHFYPPRTERSRMLARSLEKKPQQSHEPKQRTDDQPAVHRDHQSTSPDPLAQPHTTPSRKAAHKRPDNDVASEPIRMELPPAENVQVAVNQVFAPWSGSKRAYYPATCFGKPFGTSSTRYLVKFEDAAPIEVPMSAVKTLELRVGDAVKVDIPNVPKVTHIIRGLTDKLSADELSKEANNGMVPVTDIYGHSAAILGPKQRKSLPSGGLTGPEGVVKVPISRIYLDTILWNQLKNRAFSYSSVPIQPDNRLQTPSERHSTPTSPSTRLSRSIRFSSGVFSGMVFAVSYGDNNDKKSRITQMILDNDGRILHDGFNELFDLPTNAPLATPSKSPASGTNENGRHLRLTRGAEDVGFACLIADRHSRRPKYMQALALNLPCLSGRWIEDCVAQGRVVDWELYLLPAGESSYLNGATKSRMLAPYPASEARLPDVISARPNLLAGQSVLIVMGRGKADEERRKAYLFLTYALGASRVERVPDVKSARAVLDQQGDVQNKCEWDWIYVDNDEKASAIATILGASLSGSQKAQSTQKSKKRKRVELTESISSNDLGSNTNVKIVGNEFVCQSLILGKLFD